MFLALPLAVPHSVSQEQDLISPHDRHGNKDRERQNSLSQKRRRDHIRMCPGLEAEELQEELSTSPQHFPGIPESLLPMKCERQCRDFSSLSYEKEIKVGRDFRCCCHPQRIGNSQSAVMEVCLL